jgi:EthD domain
MPASAPIKLIYLARRRPGAERDEFVRRWRRHGALGMSMDFWANTLRYAHCDVRAEVDGQGSIRESDFDGIGMLWFQPEPRRAFPSDPGAREIMLEDERSTFADMVASSQLRAVEHTVSPPAHAIALKLVRLIELAGPLDGKGRAAVWDDHSRGLVNANPMIVRHVLNAVIEPASETSPLRCDAVDEVGFPTIESLLHSVAGDDLTLLRDRAGRIVGSARVFVTNEVVLYDADQLAPLASSRTRSKPAE